MIQTYISKPTIRSAVQWTGVNFKEIDEFTGGRFELDGTGDAQLYNIHHDMWASVCLGDWVLKGADAECWPVERRTFEATYEIYDETIHKPREAAA